MKSELKFMALTVLVTGLFMALAAGAMVLAVGAFQAVSAETNDGVCLPLDSGKIDVTGEVETLTVSAPAGKLIVGFCVKAGSVRQGDGPEYIRLREPAAEVAISHTSGKAISHYSLSFEELPPTTLPPTTLPPTTLPPTTLPPTTLPPVTTVPPTTEPPATVPPVEVCTGEDEAEVCTSSTVTLEVAEPAEPVVAEPSFTG